MSASTTFSKEAILEGLVDILKDMTSDWDMDFDRQTMGAQTRLIGDLEFESIDVVQFIVAVEERFGRRDLPFEKFLMRDGRYADELYVRDAVDFLHAHLNGQTG